MEQWVQYALVAAVFLSVKNIISKEGLKGLFGRGLKTKIIANGIIFGYITHVIFDIIFSFVSITIFWPLPISPIRLFQIDFINSYYLILSIITSRS